MFANVIIDFGFMSEDRAIYTYRGETRVLTVGKGRTVWREGCKISINIPKTEYGANKRLGSKCQGII
jgi:hypothetical protein